MFENNLWQMEPVGRRENTIQGEKYRFLLLTPCLIRMEYRDDGCFEDPSLEVNTIFFRRSNYIKHLTNALKQGFFYFPKYLQNYFLRVIIMALVALYQK